MLCFGFVTKAMLMITEQFWLLLSSAYTASRPSLYLTLSPAMSTLGMHNKLGTDSARITDPI